MKYLVTISEIIDYTIEVSAKDEEEATSKASDLFEKDKSKFEIANEDWRSEVEEVE